MLLHNKWLIKGKQNMHIPGKSENEKDGILALNAKDFYNENRPMLQRQRNYPSNRERE